MKTVNEEAKRLGTPEIPEEEIQGILGDNFAKFMGINMRKTRFSFSLENLKRKTAKIKIMLNSVKRTVVVKEIHDTWGVYSHAIAAGGFLFISGQVGSR